MFSTGHLLWIGISAVLIAAGTMACFRRRPSEAQLLKLCLAIGVLSEAVKMFSVIRILPMVDIAVKGAALDYIPAGAYTPTWRWRICRWSCARCKSPSWPPCCSSKGGRGNPAFGP